MGRAGLLTDNEMIDCDISAMMLIFLAVLCSVLLPPIVELILKLLLEDFVEENRLIIDIKYLNKKGRLVNTPSTFVEYAMIKRQINDKTRRLEQLVSAKNQSTVCRRSIRIINWFKFLVPLIVIFYYWSTPIITFPLKMRPIIWPLNHILSMPGHRHHIVGALGWYMDEEHDKLWIQKFKRFCHHLGRSTQLISTISPTSPLALFHHSQIKSFSSNGSFNTTISTNKMTTSRNSQGLKVEDTRLFSLLQPGFVSSTPCNNHHRNIFPAITSRVYATAKKKRVSTALRRVFGSNPLSEIASLSDKPPVAKKVTETRKYFDHLLKDDYAYMSNMMIDTYSQRYLVQEDTYSNSYMTEHLKPIAGIFQRELKSLVQKSLQSVPEKVGKYYYYMRHPTNATMPLYCRKHYSLDAPEEIILDGEQLLSNHKKVSISTLKVSQDHRFLIYLLDVTGEEHFDAYIINLETKKEVGRIKTVVNVEWAPDGKSVFYTVPDEKRRPYCIYRRYLALPGVSPNNAKNNADELIYEELEQDFFLDINRTKDWRYLIINSNSKSTSEVRIFNAESVKSSESSPSKPRLMSARKTGTEFFLDHSGDHFYIVTNENESNYKIMQVPDHLVTDLKSWEELIPASDEVNIEDVDVLSNNIVIYERHQGLLRIRLLDLSSKEQRFIPIKSGLCHIEPGTNLDPNTPTLRFTYSTPINPGVVYDYHIKTGELEEKYSHKLLVPEGARQGLNPDDYVVRQVLVPSKGHVNVPMTLVHRKDLAHTTDNLTLVNVYGAYGHINTLEFDVMNIPLLQRGWMIAYPHVRGGGELGHAWHRDGKLDKKENTFEDLIQCTNWLINERYTLPKWLVAKGASAGGMAIGVAVNREPQLFKSVLMKVPFLDVLASMLNQDLPLTIHEYEEWGNPHRHEDFESIYAYDPYWNIRGQEYPAMLITSSMLDVRVPPWNHSRYVAKLRALKTTNSLVLIQLDNEFGHFGNGSTEARHQEMGKELAFFYHTLNIFPERI